MRVGRDVEQYGVTVIVLAHTACKFGRHVPCEGTPGCDELVYIVTRDVAFKNTAQRRKRERTYLP